ncbi:MAG: hypothetical protein HQK57_03895 [Deltaproteobacteria bacterium]|nr:hypothetical protein [Deltaproteobacteria bacterium]
MKSKKQKIKGKIEARRKADVAKMNQSEQAFQPIPTPPSPVIEPVTITQPVEIDQGDDFEVPSTIRTQEDAACYLGLSQPAISKAVRAGRLTQQPDGSFLRTDLDDYLAKSPKRPKTDDETDLEYRLKEAELRYKVAKADREELIVAEMKANLIPVEAIGEMMRARVAEVKNGLEGLKNRLAPACAGKTTEEIAEIIDEGVYALLWSFAKSGRVAGAA